MDCYHLGVVDYQVAWNLQKALVAARGQDLLADSLLLLQHPHTYTLGSSGKLAHLLMTPAELAAQNVAVYEVDRGGDITYHGPGQLVGYPILKLDTSNIAFKIGVVDYIRQLEEVLMVALQEYGLRGERLKDYTGVWINQQGTLHKIAAIGVKVSVRAVTMHGFALNINTDMQYFKGIVPCGIADKPVISLAQLLGSEVQFGEVMKAVERGFQHVFGVTLVPAVPAQLNAYLPTPE